MAQQSTIQRTHVASLATGTIDLLSITAFFAMRATAALRALFESAAKNYILPITIAAGVVQSMLAWRLAYLERNESNRVKRHLVLRAAVETVVTLAIATAAVGALFFSTLFGIATPIIFTSALAAKSIYASGAALFYAGKAAASHANDPKKSIYRARAKDFALQGVVSLIGAVATLVVMVLGKSVMFGLGIAAGVFGLGCIAMKTYQMTHKKAAPKHDYEPIPAAPAAEEDNQPSLKSTTDIDKTLTKSSDSSIASYRLHHASSPLDFDETSSEISSEKNDLRRSTFSAASSSSSMFYCTPADSPSGIAQATYPPVFKLDI